MTVEHLAAGSKAVPLQEGKLRLYSMRFCPYAQRAHLILNAKNIPHDTVYINLKNKPEWYLEQFPLGKVPAICVDGDRIYESLIICDFLDEKYPENPMYPKDPLKKAKDRILIERFSKVSSLLYQCYLNPNMDVQLLHPVFDAMDHFEKELRKRGTPFYSGSKPGMVDYMIWPWCERLEMLRVIGGDNFKVPKDRFAKLWRWSEAMLEDDAVKKHYVTPEQHAKYLQSHRAGTPDFDNIL
ncbi:pyrimidodiazepine synthase-like [Cimex lectularius]|uniref:Glutathione S-transferase n=1 Tax=Cimex lectularius TaxID=79782 RepID=A0A8I6RTX2_CIMLE|nr:pyrimidodiazepine synthase-like [Cimex lectularius]